MPHDLERAFSASMQRSRSRRQAGAERLTIFRRRRRRGGASAIVIAGALALGAPLALGQETAQAPAGGKARSAMLSAGSSGAAVRAVQRALGIRVTGRYTAATARAVRRFQRRNDLDADGVVGPRTRAALGLEPPAPPAAEAKSGDGASAAAPEPAAVSADAQVTLARIAQCESGGDPTAVSPDGQYRGKYQFSRDTWQALGGQGDPAEAPETEQDRRAADLLAQRGTDPWPVCGSSSGSNASGGSGA